MPDSTNEVREHAELLLTALLELLPVKGSWTAGYTVEDSISSSLVAAPEQWATAAFHFCDLHRALAQQDQESSGVGEGVRVELEKAREYLDAQRENAEAAGAYGAGTAMDLAGHVDALDAVLAATPQPHQGDGEEGGKANWQVYALAEREAREAAEKRAKELRATLIEATKRGVELEKRCRDLRREKAAQLPSEGREEADRLKAATEALRVWMQHHDLDGYAYEHGAADVLAAADRAAPHRELFECELRAHAAVAAKAQRYEEALRSIGFLAQDMRRTDDNAIRAEVWRLADATLSENQGGTDGD